MKLKISKVYSIPFEGFEVLKSESQQEGFRFLERLESEWMQNINRFNRTGEALFLMTIDSEIVGIGGINQCPYTKQPHRIGRLRHFYILKKWRRQRIGFQLLDYILQEMGEHFDRIRLRTDTQGAAKFYKSYGFHEVVNHPDATHEFSLKNKS